MPASQIAAGAAIAIVLFALTTPWLRRRFRAHDEALVNLVTIALALKLLASIARYLVAYQIYGGVADAAQYYRAGAVLAPHFRHFDFHAPVGRIIGTGFIKVATGAIFAVTGVTEIGGYFVFSWLSFLGLWLFFLAFRMAVPEGNAKRYAWLLFLLPSMLFWPSEIGKEAWMTLGLGLGSYGAARVLTRRKLGFVYIALACLTTGVVRPQVTVLFLASLSVAYLIRPESGAPDSLRRRKGSNYLGATVLVGGLVIGALVANSFFTSAGIQGGLTGVLNGTSLRTTQGGSHFTPAHLSAPQSIPLAVLSVSFRPFPWEARNIESLLAAAEGTALIVLIWMRRHTFSGLRRRMIERPYLAFCLLYAILFAFAFSAVGNFGILARERVMQLPFFVVLLALPDAGRGRDRPPIGSETAVEDANPPPAFLALTSGGLAQTPITGLDEVLARSPHRLAPAISRQE